MNIQNPITVKQACIMLQQHGLQCTHEDGEFRVNYRHGAECTAYYTTDLEDAVATGVAMAQKRERAEVGRRNKNFEHMVQQ